MRNLSNHSTKVLLVLTTFLLFFNNNAVAQTGNNCFLEITTATTQSTCHAPNEGSILVTINKGKPPFRIEWMNERMNLYSNKTTVDSVFLIENLAADTYHVLVKDQQGCTATAHYQEVTKASDELQIYVDTNPVCISEGFAYVHLSGAEPPYWVVLTGAAKRSFIARENQFQLEQLPAGNYQVQVSKAGCRQTAEFEIQFTKEELAVHAFTQNDLPCDFGEEAIIDITGGTPPYKIYWTGAADAGRTISQKSRMIQKLPVGEYEILVKDKNGCESQTPLVIKQDSLSLEVEIAVTDFVCQRPGLINLHINGGHPPYQITWQSRFANKSVVLEDDFYQIIPVRPDTFQVWITDGLGCDWRKNITVKQQANELSLRYVAVASTLEKRGQLMVEVLNGQPPFILDLAASNIKIIDVFRQNNFTVENLPPSRYLLYLVDANGCAIQEAVTIPNEGPASSRNSDSENPQPKLQARRDVQQITLFQNTPNPFIDETSIPFFLPQPETVELTIHDMDGKIIFSEKMDYAAGLHYKIFQKKNLSNGIFICTLKTATTTKSIKLIVN